jgi:hypothetical protein
MDFIKTLVEQQFNIFNVDISKCPVNKKGNKMSGWGNKNYEELVAEHNYSSEMWGISLGKQTNDRYILSLDFDIYLKSVDGDCSETKQLLSDYLNNCLNKNGMYSSSTKGNVNVLVDYTRSPTIKDCVEELGSAKFQRDGLEILLRGNQVIPPTQTNCKRTKMLGKPRAFKTPSEPFYVIEDEEDFTFKFIKKLFEDKFNENKAKNKSEKNTTKKATDINSDRDTKIQKNVSVFSDTSSIIDDTDEINTDMHLDLLFNVIKNEKGEKGEKIISWDYWFQIAGILKYNDYDYPIFKKYSDLFDTDNDAQNLWNGMRNKN